MITIKLIPPKGYATIKPLHDSTGRLVRCAPTPTTNPAPARNCCANCPIPDCGAASYTEQGTHQ